jgi:hypothetical protein
MISSEENRRDKSHTSRSIEADRKTSKMNIDNENDSQHNDHGVSKSEKIDMLKKIFLTNSSFNKHTKEYFITRFQIILILKQSNILNERIISKTQADLLLTKLKQNYNKYTFVDFINYLTEICRYIFKEKFDKCPKKFMNHFLDYLINNYYECFQEKLESNYVERKIDNNCTMNSLKKIIESNIDKHALKLLLSISNQLKKIYICYFTYENSKKVDHDNLILNSMENFITFGKDFEIMPYMIKEKNYVTYYNLLLKHQKDYTETINDIFQSVNLPNDKKFQDLGHCFKFSSFILFLYHFSLLLYYKKFKVQFSANNTSKPEDIEIILFFLQKLEHSDGISKYIIKKQRTNESKFTFIPTNKDIEIAIKELSDDKYGGKTLMTNINDYVMTSSMFNDDNKELTTIENNTTNNNIFLNTCNSFDNNQTITYGNRTYNNKENLKVMFNSEEICKNSKNMNDIINTQLIQTLNNTSVIQEKPYVLRGGKKPNNNAYNKTTTNNDNQTKNAIIPILDLENFLNVNSEVVKAISDKLDSLAEIYLKYSKISDKLEFNRMSFSAFLKFLKTSDILIGIPENQRENYRKMGERLTQKNINVSEIKTYNKDYKGSVPCKNAVLTEAEKDYKMKIAQIVNAKNNHFFDKISIGEASVIFNSLTNTRNFPIYNESTKLQFDRNSGIDLNIGDSLSRARIFDKKTFLENQQNVPGKMDFLLFIKSFELIAAKIYPDETLNNAVLLLLNKKIFPALPKDHIVNSNEINEAMAKLGNKDINYFLNELAPLIKPIYLQFADSNQNMKFTNLLEFYTRFDLFPELITLTQMKTIFFTLNELSNNTNTSMNSEIKNTQIQTGKIDFNSFMHTFGLTAMFFNYEDIVTDSDRLLYVFYRIYNSKPLQECKLEGRTAAQACKNLNEFLKNFLKKFEKKKKEEKNKNKFEKEKEKLNQTNKETIHQLDLQFNFNEGDDGKDDFYNSFI